LSLLRTSRRWKLTAADVPILIVGLAFIGAGLIITWRSDDHPLSLFWASACLTVGAAIALVGVVLRFQLDLEDELDEAKQARVAFEKIMRADVEVISRRVNDALAALPIQSRSRSDATEERNAALKRELEDAKRRVLLLETELKKPRLRQRRELNLLEPLVDESSTESPIRTAKTSTTFGVLLKMMNAALIVITCLFGLGIALFILGWVEWALFTHAPDAHQPLFAVYHLRFHLFPQENSWVMSRRGSKRLELGEEYVFVLYALSSEILVLQGPKKLLNSALVVSAFVTFNALLILVLWLRAI